MAYGLINSDTMADSSGGVMSPISSVMRNRIINGAMVINQRGWNGTVSSGNNQYTLDRWNAIYGNGGWFSVAQSSTAPAGFVNSLLATTVGSHTADIDTITQNIEGYNIADLAWGTANAKTVTLSFWVQSSLTGTFGGSLQNSAKNRSYPFSYTISSANTWTQISVTIAGDTTGTWATDNSTGIQLNISLGCNSTYSGTAGSWAGADYRSSTGATSVVGTNGATFYITGVQLEKGSSATGFEYRQYGQELALCQRYFSTINDWYLRAYNLAGTVIGMAMTLPVTMRATPTTTIVGTPTYVNCSGMVAVTNFGSSSMDLYAFVSGSGDTRFNCSGTSNYITSSAEL